MCPFMKNSDTALICVKIQFHIKAGIGSSPRHELHTWKTQQNGLNSPFRLGWDYSSIKVLQMHLLSLKHKFVSSE